MEELVSFHVDDVPVFLRMDLAFRDERDRVRIVDWKTGRRAGKFNDVQIAGYALYAAEKGWGQATAGAAVWRQESACCPVLQ